MNGSTPLVTPSCLFFFNVDFNKWEHKFTWPGIHLVVPERTIHSTSPELEDDNLFDILKLKCIYQLFRKYKGNRQLIWGKLRFSFGFSRFSFFFFYATVKQNNFICINPDLQWYKKTENKPKQMHICFTGIEERTLQVTWSWFPKDTSRFMCLQGYMSMTGFICALPTLPWIILAISNVTAYDLW